VRAVRPRIALVIFKGAQAVCKGALPLCQILRSPPFLSRFAGQASGACYPPPAVRWLGARGGRWRRRRRRACGCVVWRVARIICAAGREFACAGAHEG
jgi:hypothetical protein